MIGKVIGAIAGERLARQVGGINGPGGAVLGALAVGAVRRLGPLGLAAAALGGYALKKHYEKRDMKAAAPRP